MLEATKIGNFMERKECNAEGKPFACYLLLNYHQRIIDMKYDYLKNEEILLKMIF